MDAIDWVSLDIKRLGENTMRIINNETRDYFFGNIVEVSEFLGNLPNIGDSLGYGISLESYEKLKKVTKMAGNGPC